MNLTSRTKDIIRAELRRINACIPLKLNLEEEAIRYLNDKKEYCLNGMFNALKEVMKKHDIQFDIKGLSVKVSYPIDDLKKYLE